MHRTSRAIARTLLLLLAVAVFRMPPPAHPAAPRPPALATPIWGVPAPQGEGVCSGVPTLAAGLGASPSFCTTIISGTMRSTLVVRNPWGVSGFEDLELANYIRRVVSRTDTEVVAEIEVRALVDTRAPYPVDIAALPTDLHRHLQPQSGIQSDDPAIVEQARALAKGSRSQAEAVDRILAWVRAYVTYDFTFSLPNDASSVFRNRQGTCDGFSRLSVAMLRAGGVPARHHVGCVTQEFNPSVVGIEGMGHAWIDVYYPDVGWVASEPQSTVNVVSTNHLIGGFHQCGHSDTTITQTYEGRFEPLYSVRTAHTPQSNWTGNSAALVPAWDRHPLTVQPTTLTMMLPLGANERYWDLSIDSASCGSTGWQIRFGGASSTSYTVADGLAGNGADRIVVAPSSEVCVASYDAGLSRFDGQSWQAFTTTDDGTPLQHMAALAADRMGGVWLATGWPRIVYRYDGEGWTSYATSEGLTNRDVSAIAVDASGGIWFGTHYHGVVHLDGERWTVYTMADGLASGSVGLIASGSAGHVWAYGSGGLSRFDGRHWQAFSAADRVGGTYVAGLAVDHEGSVWLATDGKGVLRFDGTTWTHYTRDSGLPSDYAYAIGIDARGEVWVGTDWDGLGRYDGERWFAYSESDGLPHANVRALAGDPSGGLWLGTYDHGVSLFDPGWARAVMAQGEGLGTARFRVSAAGLPIGRYRSQLTATRMGLWPSDTMPRRVPAELHVVAHVHDAYLPMVANR